MKKQLIIILLILTNLLTFAGETVYKTKSGEKYHAADCRWGADYKNSRPISLEDAIAAGYKPCTICHPPTKANQNSNTRAKTRDNITITEKDIQEYEAKVHNFVMNDIDIESKDTIASFNVLHLGWNNGKNYKLLADVIDEFDLVGLQEVMKKEGLIELVSVLNATTNSNWNYHISDRKVGRSRYKEYYAYVYNDEVEFLKEIGFYPDSRDHFERDPYGANFKIDNFDFTYVLLHSIYGDSKSEREFEASKLDDVYNYFQDNNDEKGLFNKQEENDVLIGGDFNLRANNSSFDIRMIDMCTPAISPYEKTTIGNSGLVSTYDNIFYSRYSSSEIISGNVYNFVGQGYAEARDIVSDHIPVYVIIDGSFDDD